VESAKGVLRRFLFEMKKQFSVQARVPTDYIQIQRTFLLWLRMATSKGKVSRCPSPETLFPSLCLVVDTSRAMHEPCPPALNTKRKPEALQLHPTLTPGGLHHRRRRRFRRAKRRTSLFPCLHPPRPPPGRSLDSDDGEWIEGVRHGD
jgi:hypothetical protein